MTFDIVTIFPAMVEHAMAVGVVGRALERGLLQVAVHDLRDFTNDRHRVVDDMPFGGGPGMVMKPDPIFRALDAIEAERGPDVTVLLTSPQGTPLTQTVVRRLSGVPHVVVLCGRYEGIDERVKARVTEEISIGDYVLSGGELPALVLLDAVARYIPGVVGDEQSVEHDSFSRGLLDFPQYTRPAALTVGVGPAAERTEQELRVPDVLLSGHHAEIRRWRRREALRRTLHRRPELLAAAELDDEERTLLRQLTAEREQGVRDERD